MNFFERQKEIENTKETSLEEIKKNQESLKASVERMEKIAEILYKKLNINDLDIALEKTKATLEETTKSVNNKFYEQSIKNLSRQNLIYKISIFSFIGALILVTFMYFKNIKAQEDSRHLLEVRINSIYAVMLDNSKFWYDKKQKKFYIKDQADLKKIISENRKKIKKLENSN